MSQFLKKILFWVILIVLMLSAVLFINWKLDSNKSGEKQEKSENNPNQKTPQPPNNDDPTKNPQPIPPTDTENWWLTDEEIGYAYQEIRKEIANSPEIQLVSPSVARVIQKVGEISEDLKKAKIIFFPINNSENHESSDTGSHWTLLVLHKAGKILGGYHYNSSVSSIPANVKKLTDNLRAKLNLKEEVVIYPGKNVPQQTNGSDCGVHVIAFTRALVKRFREDTSFHDWGLKEKDLIFTITEERQKLKAAGFPKKGTPGKDYDIGDDVEYLESEEELISQWWPTPDNPFHQLRKKVRATWGLDIEEKGSLYDHADNFQEFSQKVRLLSGKNLEKDKLQKIYRLKKILKACSLSLAELKKTKSFAEKNNFGDKLTKAEKNFIEQNLNKETVEEINNLYNIYFQNN